VLGREGWTTREQRNSAPRKSEAQKTKCPETEEPHPSQNAGRMGHPVRVFQFATSQPLAALLRGCWSVIELER
jgi:hypothetical protein